MRCGGAVKADVYFRILGPLEVRRDGQPVDISAAKLRIILASLLLRPGEVVPVATLVDRLWDENPPAGARATLQTYTARLRRLLGVDGLVQTREGGYAIELPPASSDIQDLDTLLETARSAAARADRQAALEALRQASTLWRGPILLNVESAVLHREESTRLRERCLDAAEQRFELELAVGNHRGIIVELRALTAAHPLRERLRAQLMRAFYRSGRQAEALEVYRDTRTMLQAELGLDPGNELRSLQQVVLLGHDETEEPEPTPYPVLCQLPPSIADFVGRAAETAQLERQLTHPGAVPIALISGVAGVGKSTLAVHVAHRLRPRFPDGQLYANLEGAGPAPRDPAEILGEFLHALGHAPAALPRGVGARAAAFRTRVADRRILILLDDAADADQVMPLLPGTPGAAVLVTSRRTLPELPGAHNRRLQPFSVEEGVTLLSQIVDRRRVSDEREVAEEIVDLCGRLPLAVRIVGARLQPQATIRLSTLAERLRDDFHRLDELSIGRLEVRSELELAYAGLTAPVQVALRRMGLLPPGAFAAWTLGVLCDGSGGERLAEQLTAAGLLETVGADAAGRPRHRPHDLVALYARELAAREGEDQTRAAVERLLDTLLRLGNEAYPRLIRVNEGLPPNELPADLRPASVDIGWLTKDADAWVHTERTLLLHTIAEACRLGWYAKAALLADLAIPALAVRGGFDQLQHARALIRDAAFAAGDEQVASRAETSRADILLSQRVDEAGAAFESCVPVFRRLGLHRELVHSLTGLAFARIWQGRPGTVYAEEATRIAYAAGDQEGVVLALRTQAETLLADDQPADALPLLEKALAVARELGNTEAERTILVRITACAISLGDLATAETTYTQAHDLTDVSTNALGLAWLLMHHSRIHRAYGDHAAAIAEAQRARDLMAHAGDTRGVVTASLHLAEAQLEAGYTATATTLILATLSTLDTAAMPRLKARAEQLLQRTKSENHKQSER
jgi:DNA-binding SARP family transcriptional activator/tetratricopeptide (TPR) repeat protein